MCILSHELWMTRFGGTPGDRRRVDHAERPAMAGRRHHAAALVRAVWPGAGVCAARVPGRAASRPVRSNNGAGYTQPIGRLAPGVSLRAATASDLEALDRSYHERFAGRLDAENNTEPRLFVEALVGNLEPTFYTLLGAVGFVLLIACANVASLFLSRLSARQKEIAVRLAIGASRAHLIRQFLVESLVFSVAAGALGLLFAQWSLTGVQTIVGSQLPPNTLLSLNWRVFRIYRGGHADQRAARRVAAVAACLARASRGGLERQRARILERRWRAVPIDADRRSRWRCRSCCWSARACC